MIIRKKSIAVIFSCTLVFIALALCAPLLIDQSALKNKISRELSRVLNADVRIERFGLSLLARPHLSLHGITCSVPGSYSLAIQDAYIYPSLQALLAGKLELGLISLDAPEVHVQGPRQQAADRPDATPEEKQKKAAALIESAMQSLPACPLEISGGTVVIVAPGGTELILKSLDAEMATSAGGFSISMSCTSLLLKKLSLTAQYRPAISSGDEAPGGASPAVHLGLEARAIDIPAGRDMLRAFAGTDPNVGSICEHIHGGKISSVSLTGQLFRVSDPLASAVISGHGSFENIRAVFPDMGLDVTELSGGFELDNGSIAATKISARLGKSRIQESVLHLDRARGFKPSLITAEFDLDLSEAPGFLHLIPAPDVRSEIERIKNPRGTGRGTFTLRAEADGYSTEIAIKELLLQSDYRSFPAALELQRGRCTYRAGLLSFSDFSGKLGSSTLPDFSLSFSLRDDNHFTATAQGATVALGDLRKVLASFESSQALVDKITDAEGSLQIQALALSGPLTTPAKWTVALDAAIENVSLAAAGFQGPVEVRSGVLKADQHACTLSRADMTFLDAALGGSLTLEGYLTGLPAARADASGALGEKALDRVAAWCGMPTALALRGPLKIEQSRLVWNRGGVTTFAGDLSLARGIKAVLNLRADNTTLEISELTLRDAESQCRLGMKIEDDLFSITYAGMLKKATLDGVLLENPFLQGWIKGDFNATFNQKKPRSSSARGALSWDKAGYPAFDKSPVNIPSASIIARGNKLVIESAGLTAGQDAAGLGGSISFTDEGFVMDLHLSADSIDLDAFKDLFSSDNASSGGAAREFWETPLRGTISLKVHELKKDPFVCAPFNARFSFADKAVTMTTDNTKICGIAFPAKVRITPDAITLEAHPRAMKSSMKEVFQCLTGEKAIMTGTVDIEGAVRAQGKTAALLDGLAGNFSITAQDGRIYKSGLFTKILSFLSISNFLSGGLRDMAKEGYAYQSLHIEGEIKGQIVQVRKAVLISSSFTLVCQGTISLKSKEVNLDALATPFQIQNQVLSRIPLVGSALSKPMMGVPLKITGTIDDPQISTRTTAAVTKGLIDITTDIIKFPIRIIDPIFSKNPSEGQ